MDQRDHYTPFLQETWGSLHGTKTAGLKSMSTYPMVWGCYRARLNANAAWASGLHSARGLISAISLSTLGLLSRLSPDAASGNDADAAGQMAAPPSG